MAMDIKQQREFIYTGNGDVTGKSEQTIEILICKICDWFGLNRDTNPIQVINQPQEDGTSKSIMYLNRNGAEQLALVYGISVTSLHYVWHENIKVHEYRCKVYSKKLNRWDVSVGALQDYEGLDKGYQLMWAQTRAKRRAILSIVGLSIMAEEEIKNLNEIEL
jgi:hypothetical protein